MKDFYNIRQFACTHFFKWEDGEDFDWLKKEWNKFEPYLNNLEEVENFILTLSDIYGSFCQEAYFERVIEEDVQKYSWIIEDPNPELFEDPKIKKRIERSFDKTLGILLTVYDCPEEILRQFTSIFIDIQLPAYDGYKYVFNLFKDKWNSCNDADSALSFGNDLPF